MLLFPVVKTTLIYVSVCVIQTRAELSNRQLSIVMFGVKHTGANHLRPLVTMAPSSGSNRLKSTTITF